MEGVPCWRGGRCERAGPDVADDGGEGGRAHQETALGWLSRHRSSMCLLKDLGREVF